jgi:hypothetical protein
MNNVAPPGLTTENGALRRRGLAPHGYEQLRPYRGFGISTPRFAQQTCPLLNLSERTKYSTHNRDAHTRPKTGQIVACQRSSWWAKIVVSLPVA